MNKRIWELKFQAEELAYEEHKANCIKNGRDPSIPHANALNMTFEKFALLIVRECSYVSEGYFGFRDNTPGTAIAKEMKEHFGVEECE